MIPVVNQIQSRASPVATAPARGTEAVAQVAAQPEVEVRPVEQAEATHDAAQRGRGDLDRARDAQAVAAQRQRSNQNRTVIEADSPQDRAVFRAKVIRFLQAIYREDQSFQRALERGTIIIRAVEDTPEPELRPEVAYAIYRQGALQSGHATVDLDMPDRAQAKPQSVGTSDFVAWWPK
jgi:hypothetical protein